MASTDPRKTREFGQTSDREDYDADEDPLVELARIVSEDGGFSSRLSERPERPKVQPVEPRPQAAPRAEPRAERPRPAEPRPVEPRVAEARPAEPRPAEPRPVEPRPEMARRAEPAEARPEPRQEPRMEPPAVARRPEPVAEDAFPSASDLEAELLQELETSFSARRTPRVEPEPEAPAPVAPAPAPVAEPMPVAPMQAPRAAQPVRPREPVAPRRSAPATPPRAEAALPGLDDPDELLRSIEEQLSQFEQQVRSESFEDVAPAVSQQSAPEQRAPEPRAPEYRAPVQRAPVQPVSTAATEAIAEAESLLDHVPLEEEADWSVAKGVLEPESEPEPAPRAAARHAQASHDEAEEAPASRPVRSDYHFRGPAAPLPDIDDELAEMEAAFQPEPIFEPEPVFEPAPRAASRMTAEEAALATRFPPVADEPDEPDQPAFELEPEAEEERTLAARMPLSDMRRGVRDFASLEEELSKELDSSYTGPEPYAAPEPVHTEPGPAEEAVEQEPVRVAADTGRRPMEPRHAAAEAPQGVAAASVIAPEHGMRAPPKPKSAAAPPPRRSRKGLMTAAAIVIVAAAGGGAAMYLRSLDQTPSGPPPVIDAPEGPVKIEPAQQADASSADETVGDAVYDRVSGQTPADTQEKVVDGTEEPQELARIVLPQSSDSGEVLTRPVGGDAASGDQASAGAQDSSAKPQASGDDFGPRRVSTFVVKPDGSIVATADVAGAAAKPDLGGQQMVSAQTESMEPKAVQTVSIDEPRVAGTPAAGASATPSASAEMAAPAPKPAPKPESMAPAAEQPSDTAELRLPENAMEPAAKKPAPAAEATVASAAPAAVPATTSSGFVVQLSSQTSEAAAQSTFASMQRRYPSILGGLNANIQRADLDKGTYFRVRVGPWAERSQAIQVCESLKAAGADCYVTK